MDLYTAVTTLERFHIKLWLCTGTGNPQDWLYPSRWQQPHILSASGRILAIRTGDIWNWQLSDTHKTSDPSEWEEPANCKLFGRTEAFIIQAILP